MADWSVVVARNHAATHAEDDYELVTGEGAVVSDITRIGTELGITFPEEFVSLYQTYNGIGVSSDGETIWWFFRPLEQLAKFSHSLRNWFRETHPATAKRFFPFLDWANGDGTGYLVDQWGEVMPGLYTFAHERFEFDEDQDPEEFLTCIPVTIEEFLNSV